MGILKIQASGKNGHSLDNKHWLWMGMGMQGTQNSRKRTLPFWSFWVILSIYGMFLGLYHAQGHIFSLFLLSYTSLRLHSWVLKGLEEKISLFLIYFCYSVIWVILRPFWPFWFLCKPPIAATGCILAKPMSKQRNWVNWINDWDILWKMNQTF